MRTQTINFMNDIEIFNTKKRRPKVSYFNIQPYFIAGFVAYRGYGKTFASVKLVLEMIKEDALKRKDIYIISPTYQTDTIFKNLGDLDENNILTDLDKVNEFITKIKKEVEFKLKVLEVVREKYTETQYNEWYENIINKINQDDEDEEGNEKDYNLSDVEYLHLNLNGLEPKPYFYNYVPHYLIFVDDSFNTKIYEDSKKNVFKNFVIKHRHYMTSIIMNVQSFTGGIPKQLRKNVSHWFIWKQSTQEIKEIYKEVLSDTFESEEEFIRIFKNITNENKHNFLLIDKEPHDEKLKLRKNFNEIILLNPINYNNDENYKFRQMQGFNKMQRNKRSNYKRNK